MSGCSFNVPIEQTRSDAPVVTRLPLSLGYVFTPEFVDYKQSETVTGGHKLIFPIGKASQSAFQGMFARLFASQRAASRTPSAATLVQAVDVVIEPSLTDSLIQGPSALDWAQTWNVTLGYQFLLSNPTGREIAHWQIQGSGHSDEGIDWTGLAGSDKAAAALADTLSNVESRFLSGFSEVPEIHAWLKSIHMANS